MKMKNTTTLGRKKMGDVIFKIANFASFQNELKALRKKYLIPEDGFNLGKKDDLYSIATSYSHPEWIYKHTPETIDEWIERTDAVKADLREISKNEFEETKEGLDNQLAGLRISRNEVETGEVSLEVSITYAVKFVRNVARQWLDLTNPDERQRLQQLVLPEGITYDKNSGAFGTTVLSPIFNLYREFSDGESDLVAGPGIEPGSEGYAYHFDFRRRYRSWSGLYLRPRGACAV